MAVTRYHRYVGELWDDLDLQELVGELSDFLLQSGWGYEHDLEGFDADSLQALREALWEALQRRGLLSPEELTKLAGDSETLERLLDQLIERLVREGYLRLSEGQPFHDPTEGRGGGGFGPAGPPLKFQLTEKGSDFLGFRALRDLLGSLGKSSFGRHDTRDLATGVEASGPSRPWEFGDTLNLDVSGTLMQAVSRQGLKLPLDVDYGDLLVRQCEYQSSCATVVMLDCSHSMVLYGEDRFTPDHRRQAFGADRSRRPHLPQPLRVGSARGRPDAQGGGQLPPPGHPDQHLHAGPRPRADRLRAQGQRDLPRQGLLHHALHPGPVRADGLPGQEDEPRPLSAARAPEAAR